MFTLIQKRGWYFAFSSMLLFFSIGAMIFSTITTGSPLRMGIDFTGGSLLEVRFSDPVATEQVRGVVVAAGYDPVVHTVGGQQDVVIRTKQMTVAEKAELVDRLEQGVGPLTELRFDSVGPSIGRDTTRSAFLAIGAAAVAILIFIALAFRNVPNAFRYGVCAIAKVLHDMVLLLGLGSVMGLVAGWEFDALFLTAMLTVAGFSIDDVIVVFDRIRENIGRHRGEDFETLVNRSLLETLHRSLATQLNAMFVMVAIIFFGGSTMRQFMVAMLSGMVAGTYSSLFFAVPLLVVWERRELSRFLSRLPLVRSLRPRGATQT